MSIYVQEFKSVFTSVFSGLWASPISAQVTVVTHQSLRYFIFPNVIGVQTSGSVITTTIPVEFAPILPTLIAGIGIQPANQNIQAGFAFDNLGNLIISADLNGDTWSIGIGTQMVGIPNQVIGPFPLS